MAYCKKCGTVLKKYIEICPMCGAPTGMEKTDDYGFYAGKAQHNGNGENADSFRRGRQQPDPGLREN